MPIRKEDSSLAVALKNASKFKGAPAQKRAGKRSVHKNLEDIAMATIQFCDKLIPLAAAWFADANLSGGPPSGAERKWKGADGGP